MMTTIKTGPHSYARGELAETLPDGRARISLSNGEERVGHVVQPYNAAHADDLCASSFTLSGEPVELVATSELPQCEMAVEVSINISGIVSIWHDQCPSELAAEFFMMLLSEASKHNDAIRAFNAAHTDDQDHDMTPLMERRDG